MGGCPIFSPFKFIVMLEITDFIDFVAKHIEDRKRLLAKSPDDVGLLRMQMAAYDLLSSLSHYRSVIVDHALFRDLKDVMPSNKRYGDIELDPNLESSIL